MNADVDTVEISRELTQAGVERDQADAIASAMRRVAHGSREDLVTKADLEAAINALTWRLIGAAVAIAGLAVAITRLL